MTVHFFGWLASRISSYVHLLLIACSLLFYGGSMTAAAGSQPLS